MRKSIAYFGPSPHQTEQLGSSLYGHMLLEDIQNSVIPYDGISRSAPKAEIALSPMSRDIEDIVRFALPHHGYIGQDTEDAVANFVRQCAAQLVYEGIAHFEIVRGQDMDLGRYEPLLRLPEVPVDQLFRPEHFPGTVLRLGSSFVQVVPRWASSRAHRRYTVIPANDVWILKLPRELGNRRTHRQLLGKLRDASKTTPPFVLDAMQRHTDFSEFSSTAYHRSRDEFVARETADWGWPGRWSWDKLALEYFTIYRHMRFARAMAVLRSHILDAINELFQRVNFPSRVTIGGLPTASDIDKALAALQQGEYSFESAMKVIGL